MRHLASMSVYCHNVVMWYGEHLIHCGIVTLYGDKSYVNTGSRNGFLPDSVKLLSEPMLAYLR